MTPRRLGLLLGLAALAAAGAHFAQAEGMGALQAIPMYQSEGSNPLKFSVTCPTATWTQVVSSDTISRSTFFQAVTSNTTTVCLIPAANAAAAPTIAVSSQCVTATQGVELPPNSALTDYSRAAWYCLSSSGTVSNVIKGYRTRDKRDIGNIGAAGLQ